jgi:MFS family permease
LQGKTGSPNKDSRLFHGYVVLASALFGLVALGAIIGFLDFMLELGGATGPVISGYMFDSTGSYRPAFLLCTIVSAVALGTLVLLRKAQPRTSQHIEH